MVSLTLSRCLSHSLSHSLSLSFSMSLTIFSYIYPLSLLSSLWASPTLLDYLFIAFNAPLSFQRWRGRNKETKYSIWICYWGQYSSILETMAVGRGWWEADSAKASTRKSPQTLASCKEWVLVWHPTIAWYFKKRSFGDMVQGKESRSSASDVSSWIIPL